MIAHATGGFNAGTASSVLGDTRRPLFLLDPDTRGPYFTTLPDGPVQGRKRGIYPTRLTRFSPANWIILRLHGMAL